jgi:hypothetical protein
VRLTTLRRIRSIQEGLKLLWESDERCIRRKYRRIFGRDPDLDDPRTFNEKILWLNLYWRDPRTVALSDKCRVREYVRETVGEEHLIPLLGVYEDPDDLILESLPDSFIIKAAHACGWNLVVRDRQDLDWEAARKKLRKWVTSSWYPLYREWQYRDIPRRLVVEELMVDPDGRVPADYKFFCFRGSEGPRMIVQVDTDRFGDLRRTYFDESWNRLPMTIFVPAQEGEIERPARLDEMMDVARRLSDGFCFARVDLYGLPDAVYFGELTFTPTAGMGPYEPAEWDRKMGDLIELPGTGRTQTPGAGAGWKEEME